MQIKDVAAVHAYHKCRVERFGCAATEALGWKNSESQSERFRHFADFADLANSEVLDVGCGHGDIYPYLQSIHGELFYTGIDQSRSFLDVAVQRFDADENTRFLLGDFCSLLLPSTDYVICCGALNYRNSDPNFLFRMINRFFDASRKAVGLSLLERVDFDNGILVPSDPDRVVEFCERLSANVVVKNDPDTDHFSVFIYHAS